MFKKIKLSKLCLLTCFCVYLNCVLPVAGADGSGVDPSELQHKIMRVASTVRQAKEAAGSLESVVVIGAIGSGKSTLITYLAKRPLTVGSATMGKKVLDTETPLPGFHISHGMSTGTRMPCCYHDKETGITYWDCPGFGDPLEDDEITHAFSIREIFQELSKVRIILVASEESITTRGGSFLQMINRVYSTFADKDRLKSALSLVITKQRDVEPSALFSDLLEEGSKGNNNLGIPGVRDLLEFFASNPGRVSCLPFPTAVGPYDDAYREPIQAAIASCSYMENPAVSFTVGSGAKALLSGLGLRANAQISQYVHDSIGTEINRICEGYITGHAKPGRALKADFATFVEQLNSIRMDRPENFTADLGGFLSILGVQTLMRNVYDQAACLDFFQTVDGSVVTQPDQWKLALNDVTIRLSGLAGAEEVATKKRGRHLTDTHDVKERWTEEKQRGFKTVTITKEKWSDCHVYALDEQVITYFPTGPFSTWPASGLPLVDDWRETDETESEQYYYGEH